MNTKKKQELIEKEAPKEVLEELMISQNNVKMLEQKYQQAIQICDTQLKIATQLLGFENPKEFRFDVDLNKGTITGTKLA